MPRSNPSRPRRRNRWQVLSPDELKARTCPRAARSPSRPTGSVGINGIYLDGGHGQVAVDLTLPHLHPLTMSSFVLAADLALVPAEPPATAPALTPA